MQSARPRCSPATAAKGASIVIGALSGDSERLGFLRYAAIGTRENQLFLAEAGQREIPELDRFRDYFRNWVVTGPHTSYGPLLTRLDDDEPFRTSTAQLLADAGTGVAGLRISKTPLKVEAPTDIKAFREALGDPTTSIRAIDDNQVEILNLWATHTSPHPPPTELNLREESDGTQRLLHLARCSTTSTRSIRSASSMNSTAACIPCSPACSSSAF